MIHCGALKLALKIDADTYRGTRDGVPRLVEILKRHEAGATFFFALGPDHTGLYGKALPSPDIGRRCADAMRATRDAGFEIGMQGWDCAKWRRAVAGADAEWTARQMAFAVERFEQIFGERPTVHGASGCRMNKHAFRNTQALGFDYASDTRGAYPFIPVVRAEIVACPQVPTTLAIDQRGVDALLRETEAARHHVFTWSAHSTLQRARVFEQLLEGWKSQGYELVALRELLAEVALDGLALHTVTEGPVALQGPEFLAETEPAEA